jgi:hypothetical protein
MSEEPLRTVIHRAALRQMMVDLRRLRLLSALHWWLIAREYRRE